MNDQDKEKQAVEALKQEAARNANKAGANAASNNEEKPAAPLEFASEKDFQFQQAIKFLKGQPVTTAQTTAPAVPPATKKN